MAMGGVGRDYFRLRKGPAAADPRHLLPNHVRHRARGGRRRAGVARVGTNCERQRALINAGNGRPWFRPIAERSGSVRPADSVIFVPSEPGSNCFAAKAVI